MAPALVEKPIVLPPFDFLHFRPVKRLSSRSSSIDQLSIYTWYIITYGLPWWFSGKESACNSGDLGSVPGLGRSPGEGNGNPLQVFLPGKFHAQKSLAGYRTWGHKELTARNIFTFPVKLSGLRNWACGDSF